MWVRSIETDVTEEKKGRLILKRPGEFSHVTCAACGGVSDLRNGVVLPSFCPHCGAGGRRSRFPTDQQSKEIRRLEREVMRLIQMDGIATDCPAVIKYEDDECDSDCDVCWNRYLRAVKDGLFYNVRGARSLETAIRKTLERDDAKRPPQAAKKGSR